jgi:hypothetical protein
VWPRLDWGVGHFGQGGLDRDQVQRLFLDGHDDRSQRVDLEGAEQ